MEDTSIEEVLDEPIKDIEYNGVTYNLLLNDNLIVDKNTNEQMGILKEDGTIVFFNELPENNDLTSSNSRLYNNIYGKDFFIEDLFLLILKKNTKTQDLLVNIESIDIERKKVILSENDIIRELDIDSDNHILLNTDEYEILDIERLELVEEKILEDHVIKLTKDVIKEIVLEDIITDDKSYTDNEKKEELTSELIALLNAYNNEELLKEITEMCEQYIILIKESKNKNINNKEYLDIVLSLLNNNKLITSNYIKPIVSSKRIIYVEKSVIDEEKENEDTDQSIILSNFDEEITELNDSLSSEAIQNLNYKSHLNVDLDKKYDNYQTNNDNKKFITDFEGEYIRDCISDSSCVGAKVTAKKFFHNLITKSFLQNNYSYDNVRTRNELHYPKLDSDKTLFEVLKGKEKLNINGFVFFPPKYSFKNLNLNINSDKLSLKEISFLYEKSYSYELFKHRISNDLTMSKEIDNDTLNIDGYIDNITYYLLKNVSDISKSQLGYILQKNLPTKEEIVDSLDILDYIYDFDNLHKSLHNFNIRVDDMDINLKTKLIDKIKENIKKYVDNYKKIVKPKEVNELKVKNVSLSNEERSKLSIKYILKLLNIKKRNIYIQKYIDLYLRYPEFGEDTNYLYNKYNNDKSLCKHYLYLVKEDLFDDMLNIYADPEVKDGFVCCKNCGEYLCPEGFSPLQGFSDGKPIQTNEKLENDEVEKELSSEQFKNKQIIEIFERIFNVELNYKDKQSIIDIFDTIDNKALIEKRYSMINVFKEHPSLTKIRQKYNVIDAKTKKEKQKMISMIKKEESEFNRLLKESNRILSSIYLLLIFVQTAIPQYTMKVKLKILNLDKDYTNLTQESVNPNMLNYIERILLNYKSKDDKKSSNFEDIIKFILDDSSLGLNNIYNHMYDTIDYFKDNYIINKRISKYVEYLKEGENSVYTRDSWASYKPDKNSSLIVNIDKQTNVDKTFTSVDKRYENNALLTEIYDIVNKEKYKQLGINISEFMNNESYKRLAKYCLQLHGVSKKPIQILNLLFRRLVDTLENKSIEDKLRSIGWNSKIGFESIVFNDLNNVLINEIPDLYKQVTESGFKIDNTNVINTLKHINENNFDLKIMSTNVDVNKIYSYDATNIYPYDNYEELKKNKSKLLDKIFRIYCKDKHGNIIKKKDNKYLNFLLLDFNDTDNSKKSNCSDMLNDIKENFKLYLKFLRDNHVLKKVDFVVYNPFYEKDSINNIFYNNLKTYTSLNNLQNFIKSNKYLDNDKEEYYENFNRLLDISLNENDLKYLTNNSLKNKIRDALSNIFTELIDNIDNNLEDISNSLETCLGEHGDILQIRRIELYYGLKQSAGVTNKKVKGVKIKTISNNIVSTIKKILEDKNKDIKINFINNILSIVSYLSNDKKLIGTYSTNIITKLWKLNKERAKDLSVYFQENSKLIHEDIFTKSSDYDGFNSYKNNVNFKELFDYINNYSNNIRNLVDISDDREVLLNRNIDVLINYVLILVLKKFSTYITSLSDPSTDIYEKNKGIYEDSLEEVIDDCSKLYVDIVQNIVEEYQDVSYIHENRNIDLFNRELSKQKEREKSTLVSELTSQSNEERLLTVEKQKAGLSNWFDNLSKQNEAYKNSEQYKLDNAEERVNRIRENYGGYITEEEIFMKEGINLSEILKEETSEDLGYNDGRDLADVDEDYENDDGDNLDGYDN